MDPVQLEEERQAIACPSCGASEADFRYPLVRSSIVTCRRCELSFVSPRVSSTAIQRKLQEWAEQDVIDGQRLEEAFSSATRDYYRRFLRRMQRHVRLPGRELLDVGCGTGQFLRVAATEGWRSRGIEIGRRSADYARNQLGLDVSCGSLYEMEALPEIYDAVSMIEVIEHLEKPLQALAEVRRLLRPDGLLLVTTPNFDSLFRRLFGNRWWVINCEDEHIVLYNIDTLKRVLEDEGFEVAEWYLQGIDLIGMARTWLAGRRRAADAPGSAAAPGAASESSQVLHGYHQSRVSLGRVKAVLGTLRLISLARLVLRLFSCTFSWRRSPTYGWGEQLVVIARKKPDSAGHP